MSPVETQDILSEDTDEARDNDNSKLVPVSESIRYRKRAQNAEKRVQVLTDQLTEAQSEAARMSEQLRGIHTQQELTRRLIAEGVIDLEAGVIIAKARMGKETEADLDGVIEQLKKEKHYLFGNGNPPMATKKTAGVKDRSQSSQTMLEKAAKKAAVTGNRTDLQEYLKLRRNFL